jgi:23S rRNA pseudouridine2605 synthase
MSKQRTNKSSRPASSRPFSSDKPKRKSSDKPFGSTAKKTSGFIKSDKPFAGKSKRSEGSSSERSFDSRSKKSSFKKSDKPFSSRSSRSEEFSSEKSFGDKPKRSGFNKSEKSFSSRPKRSEGFSSDRSFDDKPKRGGTKSFGDKPKRDGFKSFDDKPKRSSSKSFDDKPKRSGFGKSEKSFSDRPKRSEGFSSDRSFDDKPKRGGFKKSSSFDGEERNERRSSRSVKPSFSKDRKSDSFEDRKPRSRSFEDSKDSEPKKRGAAKKFDSDDLKRGRKSYGKKLDRLSKDKRYTPSPEREDGATRLNKYISNSGICSRREADQLIIEGLVKVNGETITELGYKVQSGDVVKYNNKIIRPESLVYVLLNKPKDFITTMDDEGGRKTVMDLVATATKERIFPVGRLDRNTTGLLLLTNDGELTQKLTHPSFKIKKIYEVELNDPISPEEFERLQKSHITLYDGPVKIDDIAIISPNRKILGIEIHEGRNRIVRRIFESMGKEVVRLDRVMYAGLTKKNLQRGKWRFLTTSEVNQLKYLI